MEHRYLALSVAVGIVVGISIGFLITTETELRDVIYELREPIDLSTNGFAEVDVSLDGVTVALEGTCRSISFDVTSDQAFSIDRGMHDFIGIRPLTHDLIVDIFDNFDITLKRVKIDRYENQIYKATLVLENDSNLVEIDLRPSDALALAARKHLPVYMKEAILMQEGVQVC